MSDTPSITGLVEQLKRGVVLLEQLHVLAQTQTLLLEAGNVAGLTNVVEAKEKLVGELVDAKASLSTLLSGRESAVRGIPELVTLKDRALYLLQRISEVEGKNQTHLQELRAGAIEQSLKLRNDRKIRKTYGV
jgi:hypothetical protein